MKKTQPIPKELLEYLEYSAESPSNLVWKKSTNRKIKIGSCAGSLKETGYWTVRFNKKEYLGHRVVWFIVNGGLEVGQFIDHADGNPANNEIGNLRIATLCQNSWNTTGWSNKKSNLPKNVSYSSRLEGYMTASIMCQGVSFSKSSYDLNELISWLTTMRVKHHKEFSNCGEKA